MKILKLLVKAPAKINLSLDVLHKRPDGFHEVEMIMTTIDLADRIELAEVKGDQILIESQNRFVPDDQRNLAFQAAKLLKERYQVRSPLMHRLVMLAITLVCALAGEAATSHAYAAQRDCQTIRTPATSARAGYFLRRLPVELQLPRLPLRAGLVPGARRDQAPEAASALGAASAEHCMKTERPRKTGASAETAHTFN